MLRKSTGKLLPVVSQLFGGSGSLVLNSVGSEWFLYLAKPSRWQSQVGSPLPRRLGIKGIVEGPLKRPFDKKPPARGERLPVADKLRTDRGEAETPTENVPLGRFPTLLRFLGVF